MRAFLTVTVIPVRIRGDPFKLSRALRNLVDNAARHAESRNRASGGTGPGLAIGREISVAHGGSLHVEAGARGARPALRPPYE